MFKVGDEVISLYHGNKGSIGVILKVNNHLNNDKDHCHLVQFPNGNANYHPKYIRVISKLEKALK